ncbi:MAG: glycosyltransferase family 9 protein [Alphaproteobacteria bacterium]
MPPSQQSPAVAEGDAPQGEGRPSIQRMRRRWWMFQPLDLLVRLWPVFRTPRGLLVVRMDGIGDMVLFRRSLDHYAEAFGVAAEDITVLGCHSWGSIAAEVFSGYRVRTIDEHAFERNPFYRFREALWVRRQRFAIAVCDIFFRKALTADSLVWLSQAPVSVVSHPYISPATRAEFNHYLGRVGQIIDTGPYPTHETDRHRRFVSEILGRTVPAEPPSIPWREATAPVPAGRPYVVLNFGSNEPGRRWPFDSYIAIARGLLDAGYRVVFTGGPGEMPSRPRLRRQLNRPGVIDLIDRTPLPMLLDLMRRATAVVSNDTGPAHISIALGTPTVVIVGGGHFGSFLPYPQGIAPANARIVHRDMECYHCFWRCHRRADRWQVFPCIAAVTPEAAWAALGDLINTSSGTKRPWDPVQTLISTPATTATRATPPQS